MNCCTLFAQQEGTPPSQRHPRRSPPAALTRPILHTGSEESTYTFTLTRVCSLCDPVWGTDFSRIIAACLCHTRPAHGFSRMGVHGYVQVRASETSTGPMVDDEGELAALLGSPSE